MTKPALFDRGQAVGWEMNNKKIVYLLLAFAFLAAFYVIHIPGLQPAANRLLGLTMCVLILWITEALPVTATSFILVFGMPFFGHHTNLARRLAYWYILKLGTSASKLLLAMVVTSSTLSIFVADTPTIAMIFPIAQEILVRIGLYPGSTEEEGRNLGKAMMIGIPVGSVIGGCGLISGSGINIMGLTVLEKVAGMTIGYFEWATYGLPFVIIATIPAWWVLNKTFKVDRIKLNVDKQYIEQSVRELGPLSAEEKRVLYIFAIMLALFFTSDFTRLPLTLACFLAFILTISPGIGVVNWQKAYTRLKNF